MSHFIRNGNTFRVAPNNAMDIQDKLPVGNYTVKVDAHGGIFLDQVDSFNLPSKLYGNTTKHTERILNSFFDRPNSTGVMLNGEKGSGKTLLAKNLSVRGSELGLPTIIINQPLYGDEFNTFIQNIDQPAIVMFDEFEKIYDEKEQERVLTLLDGVYPSKKMFIITCNDKYRVDTNMKNRPGRIYYLIDFHGLDVDFIREYCNDVLTEVNKGHVNSIVNLSTIFSAFNFDMLKAMCEEVNRYNESPQEVIKLLNVKAEYDNGGKFTTKLEVFGKVLESYDLQDGYRGNPFRQEGFTIDYWEKVEDEEEADWQNIKFALKDLIKIDSETGEFIFKTEYGQFTLTREKPKFDMSYYGVF